MLKSFSGDVTKLGSAEDFFLKLISVKQYSLRIESMLLTLEFREKIAELRPAIAVLQDAIQEVMTCDALREVFYITLLTGNIINGVRKVLNSKLVNFDLLPLRADELAMHMVLQCLL